MDDFISSIGFPFRKEWILKMIVEQLINGLTLEAYSLIASDTQWYMES